MISPGPEFSSGKFAPFGGGNFEIVADTDTVYRIGSITKMFTALMLEQLVEAGKVHLSDPVEKYFPEVKLVQGRFPDAPPITLIQLATHTHRDWAVNRITRTPMCKARSRNGKKSSSRRFLTRITYWSRARVFPTQT
jgi:Beta-lactamase